MLSLCLIVLLVAGCASPESGECVKLLRERPPRMAFKGFETIPFGQCKYRVARYGVTNTAPAPLYYHGDSLCALEDKVIGTGWVRREYYVCISGRKLQQLKPGESTTVFAGVNPEAEAMRVCLSFYAGNDEVSFWSEDVTVPQSERAIAGKLEADCN